MNLEIRKKFIEKWEKYFPGSELPLACFYSDDLNGAEFPNASKPNKHGIACIFGQLVPVRKGKARAFNGSNLGCWGSKGLLGFMPAAADEQTTNFMVNVEKYKKSPEHVRAMLKNSSPLKANKKYLIFKRWDGLTENDNPQVVCFFCTPDVLAGLHGLANYDTMTPFCSGCEMLVAYPMKELESSDPKAVIGLLSFSILWPKFQSMLENMDDCFLNTYIWENIIKRLNAAKQ